MFLYAALKNTQRVMLERVRAKELNIRRMESLAAWGETGIPAVGTRVLASAGPGKPMDICVVKGYIELGDLDGRPTKKRVVVSLTKEGTGLQRTKRVEQLRPVKAVFFAEGLVARSAKLDLSESKLV